MATLLILSLALTAYSAPIITCPQLTCKALEAINKTTDEDQLCYMHDALHPVATIKSYPCEKGKKCEINVFDETYSFFDSAT